MKLLASILLAASCFAQTALPANWYGAGGQYLPGGSPKGSGWAAYARLISQSAAMYSFTEYDAFLADGKITTATSSGAAFVVRQFGPVSVLAFGMAGVATSGTSAVGVFPYGGIVDFKLGKTLWHLMAGYKRIVISGAADQTPIVAGVGRTW